MREAFSGYWKQTALIILLALALRLFLALGYPHVGGDSPIYESFARNLIKFNTYSHLEAQDHTAPRPTLIRVPGYPLLLAALFSISGYDNETAVRVCQSVLDTFTCLLIALLAFEIAAGGERRRRNIAQWALLLSALCPFVANYAASILTEVPTTLLWTAGILYGLRGLKPGALKRNWFLCGLMAGAATLFRPESGMLVGILGIVLAVKQAMQRAWKPLFSGTALMAAGLLLPLAPWTARNALTLSTFQMLAPTYAQDENEQVTIGYFDWCRTWLWTYADISKYLWPLETEDLPSGPPPAGSVDNEAERKTVQALYQRHNSEGDYLAPESDRVFGAIAAQHRRAHPFRFYVELPFLRSIAMWFTPRVEVLNVQPDLFPPAEAWENDPVDFSISLFLFLVNVVYVALGGIGAITILGKKWSFDNFEFTGGFTLVSVIVLRTAFFAYFAFPEPRYILEAYPCVLVLGAFWPRLGTRLSHETSS